MKPLEFNEEFDALAKTEAAKLATGENLVPVKIELPPEAERPKYIVLEDWLKLPDRKLKPGVYYCGMTKGSEKAPPAPFEEFVCGPMHVVAMTHDEQQNNFGRLLRFRNSLQVWRDWAMPMDLLRGSGDELRGEFLAMGLELDAHRARTHLSSYLQGVSPKRAITCALQVGWHHESFVLPDRVYGPKADDVTFQSGDRGRDEFTTRGTLEGWREEVSMLASGNPLLLFAISAGFAGPLLDKCNGESGGFHLHGDSSTGKTTALEAACSIWGGPSFKRSWRSTANGMEAAATLFNDCLLAVDEISECDPRDVGQIIYALGNGKGKQRASRTGAARGVSRWRCVILSSGERTIATAMSEAGLRAKAGQSLRVMDIPVDRAYGLFDDLKGFENGSMLSETIKSRVQRHHGFVGREFLERLTHDTRDISKWIEQLKALPEFSCNVSGQEKRAANRFALAAFAGELATEYDLTGWQEGEAVAAAALMFSLWRGQRGKTGNSEQPDLIKQLSDFLDRHGSSRFEPLPNGSHQIIRDRAGWITHRQDEMVYLFTSEGMHEALKGHDFRRALSKLHDAGLLQKDWDGKHTEQQRIGNVTHRVYPITASQLARCLDGD